MTPHPPHSPSESTTATARQAATAVVRRLYDAYNAHDLDAVLACWRPGGIELVPPFGEKKVPDELRAHLAGFFAAFPDARVELLSLLADDDGGVATQIRLSGTFSGRRFEGMRANGRPWSTRMAEIFVTEDGLITRMDAYMDSVDLARQIGLMPAEGSPAETVMRGVFNLRSALRQALRGRR
ncbi:ester cyclase [Streptomyces sp. 4N509B]|uniref:ester cyclase n=1 Tax=Streptomyces sp. 4N509B TaxID=3457413 RepID=UPI003FD1744F